MTVAEVFDTWETIDANYWAYYFYKVDNEFYYGATTGNMYNLKGLQPNEIRKFPVLCNRNAPEKHMFLSDYKLSDSLNIGHIIKDRYVPNTKLFWKIFWTAAPTATFNDKRLNEYLKIKSQLK